MTLPEPDGHAALLAGMAGLVICDNAKGYAWNSARPLKRVAAGNRPVSMGR
ncbi:hypothetical protein RZA67_02225 [Stenotrophomonas sp. C3(2023)]|uniref:hypothetical protein n=1 Tax=Stenotrophomonas sp. C3(2023) TaxID=3080277 RepID=UPI00293CBEB1|nr:hypothetical protein [Stenotrophomonas sp. C3(2023)]MDV3467557.1 hypothetical protein [Stenotrophomonas sp. C3(2023)]